MQALGVPADRFLLLHAAGPVEVRPAEEILDADPVWTEEDPAEEDQDRSDDESGNTSSMVTT